ncbi:MAG: gamma-glutamyltransferase [Planctomycetota bacterium]
MAGAVASAPPLATLAGLEILDAGGNAADAAVATALALAVVYPQAGNLGGGGFAVWVPGSGPRGARTLDFRETAPRELDPTDFDDGAGGVDRAKAVRSVFAAGVPGSPAGLVELQRTLGRLDLERVAEPALRLARRGFAVDAHLAHDLRDATLRSRLEASAAARAVFYPDGSPLAEGDLLVQADLARTLELLVAAGERGFYRGETADELVAEIARGGGEMDALDLESYHPVWREPLVGRAGDRTIVTMAPPSSGGIVLLQMFAILDRLDTEAPGPDPDERELHVWIEALRACFADRAEHLGDPDFVHVPIDELLDRDWVSARAAAIGERADPNVMPWVLEPVEHGGETTHLSVLDRDGNAVSLTTTLNTTFGSGIMVEGAGFLLNNEMDDFAIRPGVPNAYGLVGTAANAIESGKRPLSSMTPTVVCDRGGHVEFVVGSPGGPRIITSVFQVLDRVLVHGATLEDAIRAPRLHQQWKPVRTYVEPGFDEAVVDALVARGHVIERATSTWSDVQGVLVGRDGSVTAFSDPRRGGAAGLEGRGLVQEPAAP